MNHLAEQQESCGGAAWTPWQALTGLLTARLRVEHAYYKVVDKLPHSLRCSSSSSSSSSCSSSSSSSCWLVQVSDLLLLGPLLPPSRGRVDTASQVEPRRAHTWHSERRDKGGRTERKRRRTELLLLPGAWNLDFILRLK
ncbi:unnamed protein product [Pleuronectes platessa]|uniref:Uncharacterized protein n=1 Tax=Pleuronectes platessa TaxID=8262 RepID=A0A9N7YGX9_PLEPL|nr:unnamed protein product [Pleuronectes platessa]